MITSKKICETPTELLFQLANSCRELLKPIVYLEGGHFDPAEGASNFASHSLRLATSTLRTLIKSLSNDPRFVLGVLIDDLSLQCDGDSCSITKNQEIKPPLELPKELELILSQESLVKRDRLLKFSERTAKNRGIRALRQTVRTSTGIPNSPVQLMEDGRIIFRGNAGPITLAGVKSDSV